MHFFEIIMAHMDSVCTELLYIAKNIDDIHKDEVSKLHEKAQALKDAIDFLNEELSRE